MLPLLENALKLSFVALYKIESLDPLQGHTHSLTPSYLHKTGLKTAYGFTLAYNPPKPTTSEPAVSERTTYPLQTRDAFDAHF